MDARRFRAIALQLKRSIGNFVRGRVLGREFLLPYVAIWHINHRCNGRCNFCSRAEDIDQNNEARVDLGRAEAILRNIKALTPSLYITGGEPTLEKDIGEVLKMARQIGFWPVCVNTNAINLDKRPDVPRYADKVVVSLHSGTPQRHAEIIGVSQRQGERVFENIFQAAKIAKSYGNILSVNCVLTKSNLAEAMGTLEFCMEYEIPIAVVPAIERHIPTIASGGEKTLSEYRDLLDKIIYVKSKQHRAVVGTRAYLQQIRQLNRFHCRPSGIITISPEGNIVNPCDHKYRLVPQALGVAHGAEPIESQLRRHLAFVSAYESCGGNCLKMCYLEPALVLQNPWLAIGEFLS